MWDILAEIWRYTADRQLRDYLSSVLSTSGHLRVQEVDLMQLVHQIERLYPCPSFNLACTLRLEEAEWYVVIRIWA